MELIGRISKGSRMDQIYISKNRSGFASGEYVLIMPLTSKQEKQTPGQFKPYLYNLKNLEPIKLRIIEEIFNLIKKNLEPENIIITGSFLEPGFKFNDIDVLILTERKMNTEMLNEKISSMTGIKPHVIPIDNKSLIFGLSSDPLYSLMLSKRISLKRIIFNVKRKINYKILDLSLLKSKTLIDNFEILNGNEKYYLAFNMVSILLFIQGRKLRNDRVNKEIEKLFNTKIDSIKENLIKQDFIKKYKKTYNQTFNLIMESIKHEK